ncbi:hypothetical protein BJ508DRAFT_8549 [Ascobolus immersus RN42]|uniref:Uncharacterized protein n=1 Tax=Ascobolus immersus RN42 TaxID=1160509 RepID=A0A3N4I3I8_ASCIM|nr:hypothetical protein BJ508DRAFT_8549 [Ascobolus immersus RN42]
MSAKAKVEYHDATIAHFLRYAFIPLLIPKLTPISSHQREVALDLARQELSDSEKQYLVIDKSLGSKGTRGILDSVLQSVEEIAKKDSGSSSGLGRFVSRFKHYIGIVDRAVQHHAEITSLVWASIVLVLQVYDNDMRIKAALQECFETVLTSMVLGELYIETYLKAVAAESSGVPEIGIGQVDSDWKQRTDNALAELYAAILVLCVKARAYLDSKGLSRVTKAFVPFEEWLAPCITKIATKEKFLKDLADTGAHRQIAGTGQKVDELLNYIKDLHMELAKLSSSVSKGLEDRTASSNPVHNPLRSIGSDITDQTVFDWLNSVNPESMYQMHLDQHLVGTCDWLKSDPVYKAWVDGKQNIWLEGIPGSGKSVLAASVVQDLRQAIDKLDDVILLYHFFWVDDKPTTSPLAMVSSLISQLLLKSKPDMKASLMEILKQAILEASHFKGGQLSEEAELLQRYKSLLNILAEYARVGRILILLDGLDECSHPTLLAKRLFGQPADSLNSEYYSHVRLLLTGRPVVADLFSNIPGFKLIDMESRDDIKTMVTFKVKENPALQQIESKILGKILETSDGMFRYAALLFEELLVEVYPPIPLEDRLKSMPSGIAGMYENILERLDDATLELRRRILASVAAAERPLTVKEIQGICMTDLESERKIQQGPPFIHLASSMSPWTPNRVRCKNWRTISMITLMKKRTS